jgi:uncharacterized protein DUF6542
VSTTYGTQRSSAVALTGMGAVALAFVIALIGAGVDLLTGSGLRRTFAIALVIGAVVAALLVCTSDLYAVAVAPPLIYISISILASIPDANGAFSNKAKFAALAANWLVYGFPEMAAATVLAAAIATIRILLNRR